MSAYYNDNDPKVCAWLRELVRQGHLPDGEVDNRSILDVAPEDLRGFAQCHFFAGIGGWAYALRLAGVPEDWSVWTGSPPCQPFSAAGQRKGQDDERHLAPHFAKLVGVCRPGLLFGEQVASAAVFGKSAKRTGRGPAAAPEWAWIDDLSDRLEAARYAVGASDIPAAGVGAPHIRQRAFFVASRLADADFGSEGVVGRSDSALCGRASRGARAGHWGCGADGGLADAASGGWREERADLGRGVGGDRAEGQPAGHGAGSGNRGLADAHGAGPQGGHGEHPDPQGRQDAARHTGPRGDLGGLADAEREQWQRRRAGEAGDEPGPVERAERLRDTVGLADTRLYEPRLQSRNGGEASQGSARPGGAEQRPALPVGRGQDDHGRGPDSGHGVSSSGGRPRPYHEHWGDADWLFCRDGKWRPVEPGSFPLAHGVPARVVRLRGYGNAIVPQAAAAFILASLDAIDACGPFQLDSVLEEDPFA